MKILRGDARLILPTLEAKSIHCCVTSPPYWGLRDYGTATWDGGDAECDHSSRRLSNFEGVATAARSRDKIIAQDCKCGARRIDSQLGLEPTPDAYVANMVAIFREVRRVLRNDGTLWLNLGDSYAGSWGNQGRSEERGTQRPINGEMLTEVHDRRYPSKQSNTGKIPDGSGLKPKDLAGIPWRVAFALQADGWWLRQDIIWSKPNPMPESVTDRCTKAHEYIFLLSKSARYYYDAEAIAETSVIGVGAVRNITPGNKGQASSRNDSDRFDVVNDSTRNKRSVWEVATAPFSEAHFATFPPALIEPCILAGCPKDGTVLDPFGGAGTTGLVADRLQRNAILIELNHNYADMARTRIIDDAPLFATVE